jgi:hypothetical protein
MRKLKVSLEKREAALEQIAKGKSPYDVARELKVTPQAVYRWIAVSKAPKSGESADLVRRVERLETDIDFLKKDLSVLKGMLTKKR